MRIILVFRTACIWRDECCMQSFNSKVAPTVNRVATSSLFVYRSRATCGTNLAPLARLIPIEVLGMSDSGKSLCRRRCQHRWGLQMHWHKWIFPGVSFFLSKGNSVKKMYIYLYILWRLFKSIIFIYHATTYTKAWSTISSHYILFTFDIFNSMMLNTNIFLYMYCTTACEIKKC